MATLRKKLSWTMLGLYWPAMFISTHIPRPPALHIYGSDVTLHFTAYFILTVLFWVARYGQEIPDLRKPNVYKVILLISVYAFFDEFLQIFVGRHASVTDWISDVAGCLFALLIILQIRKWWYWLAWYWMVMFVITHWPIKGELFFELPIWLQQFEFALTFSAYVTLTLLFWRTLSPEPRFVYSSKILLLTMTILPAYALLDEYLSMLMQRGFHTSDLIAAFSGIIIASISSIAFAKHNLERENSEPSENAA